MDVKTFLISSIYQLPLLLTGLFFIIFAVVKFSCAPRAFLLLIIGSGLIILYGISGYIYMHISMHAYRWDWDREKILFVSNLLGFTRVALITGGLILMGMAAFVGRPKPPPV